MKGDNMDQNRFKSPVVWAAVVAQILTVLIVLDVINVAQQETINQVVAAVLQLLIAFGVINNPTAQDKF
jgi:phi LC3 family holin